MIGDEIDTWKITTPAVIKSPILTNTGHIVSYLPGTGIFFPYAQANFNAVEMSAILLYLLQVSKINVQRTNFLVFPIANDIKHS